MAKPDLISDLGFPSASDGEESAEMQETRVQSLGWEDLLQEGMATHSNILAWRIPWTERGARRATVCGVSKSQTRLHN